MSENGVHIEGLPPIAVANPVVELLEQTLAAAKAGQINTIGIVLVDAVGNVQPAWAGGRLGDLHLGCSIVQFRLMSMFHKPQPTGRIMRVPG